MASSAIWVTVVSSQLSTLQRKKLPVEKSGAAIKLRIRFNGVRVALINAAFFTRPICPSCSPRSTSAVQTSEALRQPPPRPRLLVPQPYPACHSCIHGLHLCKMWSIFERPSWVLGRNVDQKSRKAQRATKPTILQIYNSNIPSLI